MTVSSRLLQALALVCAVSLVLPSSAYAAGIVLQDVDVDQYPTVKTDVALTADLVPESGDPQFVVLENGIEASDVRATAAYEGRPPIDVVLLLDESGSMQGPPLQSMKDAAKRFVAAMRPEDRIAVVAFSSEPRTLVGFTSDVAALGAAIDTLEANGETALYDGLIRASKTFEDDERDRYIAVISDGGDTTSINTLDVASAALDSAQTPVYAVALESPEYDPTVLSALATRSGGRFVSAQDITSLTSVFEDIAKELRNLYSVSFTSARPATKDLEIQVIASNADVTASIVTVVANPLHAESVLPPKRVEAVQAGGGVAALLIGMLTFAAVGIAAWAIASMLAPNQNTLEQLRYYEQYQTPETELGLSTEMGRGRVMSAVAQVAESRGFTGAVSLRLERAGLPLRANEYIFFHLLATTISGIIVRVTTEGVLLTVVTIFLAATLPIMLLQVRIDRRRAAFEEQLPDVLSLLAGSLRAGWGIQQAIGLVVQEIADPSAAEFRRVEAETRFGLSFEDALRRMADRLDSEDFGWVVTAVTIQREVGGNLAEVLDIVATTIRERGELRRHVSTLTAESRFSAIILSILPFVILGGLWLTSPTYLGVALTSSIGLFALIFGAVLLVVGIVWIARLTKLEV